VSHDDTPKWEREIPKPGSQVAATNYCDFWYSPWPGERLRCVLRGGHKGEHRPHFMMGAT
jgi:hypothetical protein